MMILILVGENLIRTLVFMFVSFFVALSMLCFPLSPPKWDKMGCFDLRVCVVAFVRSIAFSFLLSLSFLLFFHFLDVARFSSATFGCHHRGLSTVINHRPNHQE